METLKGMWYSDVGSLIVKVIGRTLDLFATKVLVRPRFGVFDYVYSPTRVEISDRGGTLRAVIVQPTPRGEYRFYYRGVTLDASTSLVTLRRTIDGSTDANISQKITWADYEVIRLYYTISEDIVEAVGKVAGVNVYDLGDQLVYVSRGGNMRYVRVTGRNAAGEATDVRLWYWWLADAEYPGVSWRVSVTRGGRTRTLKGSRDGTAATIIEDLELFVNPYDVGTSVLSHLSYETLLGDAREILSVRYSGPSQRIRIRYIGKGGARRTAVIRLRHVKGRRGDYFRWALVKY